MKKFLARSRGWLPVVTAGVSAVALSFYSGIYVNKATVPGAGSTGILDRAYGLGWVNLLLIIGIGALILQAVVTQFLETWNSQSSLREEETHSRHLLEGVVGLLAQQHPKNTYRALVTIYDPHDNRRRTLLGANIDVDPEATAEVPADFGIAGVAFRTKTTQCGDITDVNRSVGTDGAQVAGIWPDVRSVLAFPMIDQHGKAFGTVNIDCDHALDGSGLNDRTLQTFLQKVVTVINSLLRNYSRGVPV